MSALEYAIREDRLEVVLAILDRAGHDVVNAVGPRGTTALLVACEHGREAIARALLDRGAKVDALKKGLNIESATMLAKIGTEKGIMVSGMKCDQTTADLSNQNLNPPDAILLASDLSQAIVTGALTRVDVRRNNIAGDGAAQLSDAVLGNLKIEMFNGIPIKEMRANSITELDLKGKRVGVEGGMVVAGLIPVMVGLTALDLSFNQLCGIWTDEYRVQHGTYTAEGITAIADALRVNGGLTVANLLGNQLDAESAKMLAEVASRRASRSAASSVNRPPLTSAAKTSSCPMRSCWPRTCHRPLSQAR